MSDTFEFVPAWGAGWHSVGMPPLLSGMGLLDETKGKWLWHC